MLQRIVISCLVLCLFACKGDSGALGKIAQLEKELETTPNIENMAELMKSYQTYTSEHPGDTENNDKFQKAMEAIVSKAEKAFYTPANGKAVDRESANHLVDIYDTYTTSKPEASNVATYLYKGAEIARSNGNFEKAMSFYKNIYDNHPNFEKAAQALFLMGFTYENDFKDLDKAKSLYEEFLQKHPEHELAKSVEFSLQNLGKPAEEIIKDFEAKKKNNIQ